MIGPMFVLVGPSASGKTTIANRLVRELNMRRAITTTTRPRRSGESESDYNFVSNCEFETVKMVEYVDYSGYRYGLSKKEANMSSLAILEPSGAKSLRAYCSGWKRPCYIIGLKATKREQAERMAMRGDSARDIERRLQGDTEVFRDIDSICDITFHSPTIEELYCGVQTYIQSKLTAFVS